jgi:DNA ligase 1
MKRFVQLFRELDETTSILEKVEALASYFREAPPRDAVWALFVLLGKPRRAVLPSSVLRAHFMSLGLIPDWLYEETRAHVGDTAETVALLLESYGFEKDAALELPLHQWLEDEASRMRGLSLEQTRDIVLRWWRSVPSDEVFLLHKLMGGGFRVGVSSGLVVRGLAVALGRDASFLENRLAGEFKPTVEFWNSLLVDDAERLESQPYPFMLAHALEPEFEPSDAWQYEWKWDGIRAQVLKRSGSVYLWSRGEGNVTTQFPELAKRLEELPDGTVLDGEIVAWKEEAVLPFAVLQTRLGRKTVTNKEIEAAPVNLLAYDLLEENARDIRALPLEERRAKLEALLQAHPIVQPTELMHPQDRDTLERLRLAARTVNAEGLMIKRRDSAYLEGRKKGYWFKHKIDPYTLDAVLIYAQAGTGRRSNLFTDYTFALWSDGELVSFTKAYSGLTDAEIAELDKWIRAHTTQKFGPARAVEPLQVFEIGFEGIAESKRHKSGIAVRFPRILRWRTDKTPFEADTLETARALL